VGHVHLHVADLQATWQFYHGVLGFEVPMRFDSGTFFAAGGYHHHIGTNIWQGAGAPPPPPDAIGLRHFTVVLPDGDELARLAASAEQAGQAVVRTDEGVLLRDPAHNGVLLTAR
jgi:catechol 2,3-dioxygenase